MCVLVSMLGASLINRTFCDFLPLSTGYFSLFEELIFYCEYSNPINYRHSPAPIIIDRIAAIIVKFIDRHGQFCGVVFHK